MTRPSFKRILLKLSGEALMGPGQFGIDPDTVAGMAAEVKAAKDQGFEICLVIGGGNIFRGMAGAAKGMDRAQADYMGMLATVMNALAVQNNNPAIALQIIKESGADVLSTLNAVKEEIGRLREGPLAEAPADMPPPFVEPPAFAPAPTVPAH